MRAGKEQPSRVFAHLRVVGLSSAETGGPGSSEPGRTGAPQARIRGPRPCRGAASARLPASDVATRWARLLAVCGDYAPEVRASAARREVSLEVTEGVRLFGPPKEVARELRNRVRGELGVEVAVGVGPNAAVARLACRLAKPGEVLQVTPEEVAEFVGRLTVATLPEVGSAWADWLHELGIRTAQDLAALPVEAVTRTFGERGRRVWEIARGGDPGDGTGALFAAERAGETVTGQVELRPPTEDRAQLRAALRVAAEQVAQHLRQQGKAAQHLRVELVFDDLRHVEMRRTLPCPTGAPTALWQVARVLVDRLRVSRRPVRRVRLKAAGLVLDEHGGQLQLPLPAEPEARPPRPQHGSGRARRSGALTAPARV